MTKKDQTTKVYSGHKVICSPCDSGSTVCMKCPEFDAGTVLSLRVKLSVYSQHIDLLFVEYRKFFADSFIINDYLDSNNKFLNSACRQHYFVSAWKIKITQQHSKHYNKLHQQGNKSVVW